MALMQFCICEVDTAAKFSRYRWRHNGKRFCVVDLLLVGHGSTAAATVNSCYSITSSR
jgi:hypothetical protein